MANQCVNVLSINGEVAALIRFMSALLNSSKENEFLGAFYPTTEKRMEKLWGVKSEVQSCELLFDDLGARVIFKTDSNEPKKWLHYVSRLYPSLVFNLSFYEAIKKYAGSHSAAFGKMYSYYLKSGSVDYRELVFLKDNLHDFSFEIPVCDCCGKEISEDKIENFGENNPYFYCANCSKGGAHSVAL